MMCIHHYGIEVRDMNQSITFYERVLHFQVEKKVKFMEEDLVFLRLGHVRLELYPGASENKGSQTHICFEVLSLTEIIRRCEKLGYPIEEGPYELENGWKNVFITGPADETIEFLQTTLLD